jgi:hypothetical protein
MYLTPGCRKYNGDSSKIAAGRAREERIAKAIA